MAYDSEPIIDNIAQDNPELAEALRDGMLSGIIRRVERIETGYAVSFHEPDQDDSSWWYERKALMRIVVRLCVHASDVQQDEPFVIKVKSEVSKWQHR